MTILAMGHRVLHYKIPTNFLLSPWNPSPLHHLSRHPNLWRRSLRLFLFCLQLRRHVGSCPSLWRDWDHGSRRNIGESRIHLTSSRNWKTSRKMGASHHVANWSWSLAPHQESRRSGQYFRKWEYPLFSGNYGSTSTKSRRFFYALQVVIHSFRNVSTSSLKIVNFKKCYQLSRDHALLLQ